MAEPLVDAVAVLGASGGIGAACAHLLAASGYRVFACSRQRSDALDEALRRHQAMRFVPCDVTSRDAVAGCAATIARDLGTMTLGIVNSVGVGQIMPVDMLDLDTMRRHFDVNVFGPVAACNALAGATGQVRRIIHVGSTSARIPSSLNGSYCASKAALDALAGSQRLERGHHAIDVTVLDPGVVLTPFWVETRRQTQRLADRLQRERIERYDSELRDRLARRSPPAAGIPAEVVAARIKHLLETRRLRRRYVVGRDAAIKTVLNAMVPDNVMDWLRAPAGNR